MSDAALVVLVVLAAVVAPLALYAFVKAETDDLPTMDRSEAERVARRDGPDERGRD